MLFFTDTTNLQRKTLSYAMIIWPRDIIIFSEELSATHFLVEKLSLTSEKRSQHCLPNRQAAMRKR